MKFIIFFVLAFARVSAEHCSNSIEVPGFENESRIVNGNDAPAGEFKYQVGISLEIANISTWCGGSLIHNKWVLTTAHCIVSASAATVYLGATKRLNCAEYYNIPESDFHTHPLYNAAIIEHDIALIQIPTTNESLRIGFVRIPRNNDNNYLGVIVVMAGWGYINNSTRVLSNHLKYGVLRVSPGNICFADYGLYYSDDTRLCVATTTDGPSTCHGDSGGPLVAVGHNLQIGVDSFGDRDCNSGSALVFTRVGAYVPWIRLITGM